MNEISATEAARNFAELLDAVEHKGETITIVRRGRAVAHIEPVVHGHGKDVKSFLRKHPVDAVWAKSIRETRDLLVNKDRF